MANCNLIICTYVATYINDITIETPERIVCSKQLAQRGAQLNSYMCVIECVVASMFEFTVNEATTSVWKVKARGRLVITTTLMLAITKNITNTVRFQLFIVENFHIKTL